MDMVSILSRIASGLAVRLAAIVAALYVASEVYSYVSAAFAPIPGVLL